MKHYDVEVAFSGVFTTRVFAASEEEAKAKAFAELEKEAKATCTVKVAACDSETDGSLATP